MKSEPDWRDFGITPEGLFQSQSMPHWLRYDPQLFMQVILHELRERLMSIDTLTKFIHQQAGDLTNVSGKIPPEKVEELIQDQLQRMKEIMDIMWEYSNAMKDQE